MSKKVMDKEVELQTALSSEKRAVIVHAIENEDLEFLSDSYQGISIHALLDEEGRNALHLAVILGRLSCVTHLLTAMKANPDHRDWHGFTALHYAVKSGSKDMVSNVLAYANPEFLWSAFEEDGQLHEIFVPNFSEEIAPCFSGALSGFVEKKNVFAVRQLLRAKASPDGPPGEVGPLHRAIHDESVDIVKDLVAAKANLLAGCRENRTLFHCASGSSIHVMSALLDGLEDLDTLFTVCQKPLVQVTLMGMLTHVSRCDLIGLLLDRKANVDRPFTSLEMSALSWAATGQKREVVQQLISRKADVNKVDGVSWRPIHRAARHDNLGVVSDLLAAKANPGGDVNAATPLFIASDCNQVGVAELLLDAKAGVNEKSRTCTGSSALFIAALRGHLAMLKLLLVRKADLSLRNDHSAQPIHIAAAFNHLHCVRLLLAWGAPVNARAKHPTGFGGYRYETPLGGTKSRVLRGFLRLKGGKTSRELAARDLEKLRREQRIVRGYKEGRGFSYMGF